MNKTALLILGLILAGCNNQPEKQISAEKGINPVAESAFLVPERIGDQLCLTFPTNGIRWMIEITEDKRYPSTYGQQLFLSKNQEITLSDKHVHHKIKAIIQDDKSGLEVDTRVDLRSFGGEVKEEKYFISSKNET